jgi:hypothetical protein
VTPEALFKICNTAALCGWLLLVALPRHRQVPALLTGALLPLGLAFVYAVVLLGHLGEGGGGFGSLEAVGLLFTNKWALLAGWVHYLAFDLFIGSWAVRDAQQSGVPRLVMAPILVATFMLGPVGLLLYFAARGAWGKRLAITQG